MLDGFTRSACRQKYGQRCGAGPRLKRAAIDGLRPGGGAKSKHRTALTIRVPLVVICLHRSPIVPATPIWKLMFTGAQLSALDCFYPRPTCKTKAILTLYKAMPFVVIPLYLNPIVDAFHIGIILEHTFDIVAKILPRREELSGVS